MSPENPREQDQPLEARSALAEPRAPGKESWWVGGWISPIIAVAFTILFPMSFYWLMGDRERDWQYGVTPYVPAQSIVTGNLIPAAKRTPKQVELPMPVTGGDDARR